MHCQIYNFVGEVILFKFSAGLSTDAIMYSVYSNRYVMRSGKIYKVRIEWSEGHNFFLNDWTKKNNNDFTKV